MNLKSRAMGASFWRFLQSLSIQGTNFVVQVILARLLEPKDFGLIAMIWVVTAVAEAFIVSGYGSALIQRQNATHVDECSVFYFNIVVSMLGYVLLWVSAPWMARFYSQPLLTPLMRTVSIVLVIGAFGHIQFSLLAKQLDFKTQCRVDIIASAGSGTVGIAMAWLGLGVWSLVAQQLSRVSMRVALAWCYSKWRPAWLFSWRSLFSMFAFGSNVLLTSLLETVYQNIYTAIIGKLFSATQLGLYSRAYRLQQLPIQSMTQMVSSVALPVFSQIKEDKMRLKNGLRTGLGLLALAAFPTMTVLALSARPVVTVLFTEKWLPCVPYLQVLCVAGAMYPLYTLYAKTLLALGRPRVYFWVHLFQRVLIVASIVVTYRWEIRGLIFGQVVGSLISTLLMAHVTGRLIEYRLIRQLRDLLPYAAHSVAVGVSVSAMGVLCTLSDGWLLVSQFLVGAIVAVAICWLLHLPAFMLVHAQVKKRIQLRGTHEVVEI